MLAKMNDYMGSKKQEIDKDIANTRMDKLKRILDDSSSSKLLSKASSE